MTLRLLNIILIVLILTSCSLTKTGGNKQDKLTVSELSGKDKVQYDKLFYKANKEKILGNFSRAADLFAQCVRKDPHGPAAMYELANIYSKMAKLKEAVYFAKKAASLEPGNVWYQVFLADAYKQVRMIDRSIKIYETLIKNHPNNLDYYYELAGLFLYAGKYTVAIEIYNQIEQQVGIVEEISLEKELIYINLNKIDKAAEELEKLISSNPGEVRYYGMLAELYQANNMNDLAFKTYKRLMEVDPNDPYVHLSLANHYRSVGENENSYKELKLAFANANLNIDKKISILLSFYSLSASFPELTEQALTLCEILIETHPREAKAFSMYGDYLYRENEISDARDRYRKAIELDNSRFFIWRQLLQIESELKDFEALLTESEQAIELFPNQAILYLFNGIANLQKKQFEEAVEVLNKGITLSDDNSALLSNLYSSLGDSYYSKKDTSASDTAYDKALEFDPDNKYVLNNYSYYLSLRGNDLEKAMQMSEKAVRIDPNNTSFQDTYGWIQYQMGNYQDAKIWIEKALKNGGDERSAVLEHYGDVQYKLGDVDEAVIYWEKAKNKGGGSIHIDKKIADKKLYE